MTATLYSWTVTTDRNGIATTVTVTGAQSATTDGGSLWQLLGAGGTPVYEVPLYRLVSAQRGDPVPPPAAGSIDAERARVGLKPFGLPETFAPHRWGPEHDEDSVIGAALDVARMTGSERLAGVEPEARQIKDTEREATAPFRFDELMQAWDDACARAWDDGYREPYAVLPGWLWPEATQFLNPVTRNVATIERADPFPAFLPEQAAEPLAETVDRLMSRAKDGEKAEAMIGTFTHRFDITVTARPKADAEPPAQAVAPDGQDINDKAEAFARKHGSFSLHFDATRNSASPDYRPWTLILDVGQMGWGLTAEEAVDSAACHLAG